MTRRLRLFILAAIGLAATSLHPGAFAQDGDPKVQLVKRLEGPASMRPAELIFDREDGQSSTLANAAVLLSGALPGMGGVAANEWGLGAGISKNTLAANKTELYQAGARLSSIVSLASDQSTNLVGTLNVLFEDDRAARARGSSVTLDAVLRSKHLSYDPHLDVGESGVDGWLYPSLGWYDRRVGSTDDPVAAPIGHHAGPYVGLHVTSRFLSVGKDASLFDRVSVDLVFVATRDSSVSGGYSRATYRYGEASLDYLLYGAARGTGWKPTISISKARGTNRVAGESHVDKLTVAFKLSYGI